MAPEAAPKPTPTGSIVLTKNFDVKSLPILTQREIREKGNFRLADYFTDLKKTVSDDKEGRRAANGELIELALSQTIYFRQPSESSESINAKISPKTESDHALPRASLPLGRNLSASSR